MDIHLTGPFAQRMAKQANGQIFGDDITAGPRRPTPEWLGPYVHYITHYPTFIEIRPPSKKLGALPSVSEIIEDLSMWRLFVHRVDLIVAGRKMGEALRMDDQSLRVLDALEHHVKRQGLEL